jgi:hypothetical protein
MQVLQEALWDSKRTNQEEQNQYERAVQQAAVRRQEVAAAEEAACGPQMPSGRTITPADVNESVTPRPVAGSSSGSSNTAAGISRAVGPVAEDFPWPYELAPAPPPPLIRVQGPDFINGPNGNAFIDTIAFVTRQDNFRQRRMFRPRTSSVGSPLAGSLWLLMRQVVSSPGQVSNKSVLTASGSLSRGAIVLLPGPRSSGRRRRHVVAHYMSLTSMPDVIGWPRTPMRSSVPWLTSPNSLRPSVVRTQTCAAIATAFACDCLTGAGVRVRTVGRVGAEAT